MTKKEHKAKSRIKKISYIIIATIITCISIIPCYAFNDTEASATNFQSVPIYFENMITGFFVDEPNGMDYFSESNSWSTAISYQYSTDIREDGRTYTEISTLYDDIRDETTLYIKNNKSYIDEEHPGYICTGINAIYTINSGNYLINTAEDDFYFNIVTNNICDYAISCSYTILNNENEKVNNLQYFAFNGTTKHKGNDIYEFEFNISEYISTTLGSDKEVLVNALTIEWRNINLLTNLFISEIMWKQSTSVSERNFNGARINYDGTVTDNELNYYNTISNYFEKSGIEKYKSSFVNYTTDYTSWIGNAVGGFLNMEIFPYFSIGGILLIFVAIGLVGYFLKVFMGG